jgi:hypothetical protein
VIDDQEADRSLVGRKLQSDLFLQRDEQAQMIRVGGHRGIGRIARISSARAGDDPGQAWKGLE